MYNLIVGSINGTVGVGRMLEHTDEGVLGYLRPGGVLDPSRLLGLPTLVMPRRVIRPCLKLRGWEAS